MIGTAVSINGPAQFITARAPAIARSSDARSSTDARRTSDSGYLPASALSFPASRPERIGVHPRLNSSATTKRPVCPYAPNTVTVRLEIFKQFLTIDVPLTQITAVAAVDLDWRNYLTADHSYDLYIACSRKPHRETVFNARIPSRISRPRGHNEPLSESLATCLN